MKYHTTMCILAINASHRGDKGHTRFLIEKVVQGAKAEGAMCEVVTLSRFKIRRCLACRQCHEGEHHLTCIFDDKDDVRAIFNKITEADIILYGTPVYIFSMSGLLKTFLDRMYGTGNINDIRLSKTGLVFHHVEAAICSKPFVTLVCCDNLEDETTANVLSYFRTFSRFMDATQVGVLVRNGGGITGHGSEADLESFPALRDAYLAFEQAGRELVRYGRVRSATERRASQSIIPVPFFRLLKRLPAFRSKTVERARQMRKS